MQNFTKRLKTSFGNPEFFFNRIYTVKGIRYYMSVTDQNRQSFFFNIEMENNEWRICNDPVLPDWILALEKDLEQAIYESLIG
jgi:hypothetical protein